MLQKLLFIALCAPSVFGGVSVGTQKTVKQENVTRFAKSSAPSMCGDCGSGCGDRDRDRGRD